MSGNPADRRLDEGAHETYVGLKGFVVGSVVGPDVIT